MSDSTIATTTDQVAGSAEHAASTLLRAAHRAWLTGLGLVVIAGEQTQTALHALEVKGQRLEPSLAAPFKRAGGAASRVMGRAGESVKQAGSTVGGAIPGVSGLVRRRGETDWKESLDRLIDEKLAPILERLEALEEKTPARRKKEAD